MAVVIAHAEELMSHYLAAEPGPPGGTPRDVASRRENPWADFAEARRVACGLAADGFTGRRNMAARSGPAGSIGLVTRLAVAIRPPADILAVLRRLHRIPEPGVNWALPEQWILRLRPLGHVDDGLVAPLVDALAAELDGVPATTCALGPATRRLGGQWLGVPVSGTDDLAATVFDATTGLVPVTHPQAYAADIVVARGRVPAGLAGEEIAGSWVADSVVLVADRSAPGRPRLEDLAAFGLVRP